MIKLSFRTLVFTCTALLLAGAIAGCKSKKKTANADTNSATDTATDTATNGLSTDSETETDEKMTVEMQNQTVFSQDTVLEYHVTIDPAELTAMDEHGNDEEYHVASLQVKGGDIDESFEEVGIRYKGAWSLHHCWDENGGVRNYEDECARLSIKLKFNKYDDDARFFGLKRLNFHGMTYDGSKLRERLSYSLFNDFGVVAPRTAHAKIYINGELKGLYIAVENVDGRFTHFRFPEGGDGNLYKEIWPNPNVDKGWALSKLKTNDKPEDNPDVSDFLGFKDAIATTTEANFESTMADWLNLENMVRYLVVDRATRNWDGIMAFYSAETSHNFYWYHDDGDANLFHLVPWDLDGTLKEFDLFMDPKDWCEAEPVPDWNKKPMDCMPRTVCTETTVTPPRCDHFVDMLALTQWPLFKQYGTTFLSEIFTYDNMNAKVTAWADQIADAVAEDPDLDSTEFTQQVEFLRSVLKGAISGFEAHLDEGLVEETVIVPPDESQLSVATVAGGLRADTVTNFEVDEGTEAAFDDFLFGFASDGSTFGYEWHTASPNSGKADLQFSVIFAATDGDWSEWGGYIYTSESPLDLTPYSRLWISLSANKDARFRIELRSDTYTNYGDIYEMFSNEFRISTEPQLYRFELKDFSYPQWAKDEWGADDGWTVKDSEVLPLVLANIRGLGFEMFPTWDNSGNMTDDTEEIIVHVDNIYFE